MHHAHLDKFAQGSSAVHRLDGRAKLVATVVYTVALVSAERFQVATLAPFAIGPFAMLMLGQVPVRFALRRVLLLSPLILALAVAQPLLLRQPMTAWIGPWQVTAASGYFAAANLFIKFALGLIALTALMSTTPFSELLAGLRSFRVPAALVMMLGFVYRYLFVLLDEAMRLRRARDFRGARLAPASQRLRATGGIIGSLFVRTLHRSERIHQAMLARGFDGTPRPMARPRWRSRDTVFLVLAVAYSVGAYCFVQFAAGVSS